MNDNRPLTYLRRLIEKVDLIKSDVGNIKLDTTPITNAISSLTDNFNAWKAPWTTARAEKIDTVTANSETIKSGVTDIKNIPLLKNGAVKSIQKGVIRSETRGTKTIPIAHIDSTKSIVITEQLSAVSGSNKFGNTQIKLSNDELQIWIEDGMVNNLNWQIVEFA